METWTQTSSCGCDYTPSTTTAAPQAQHELNNYSPRVTDTEDVDSNVSSISIPLGSQYTQDSVPDGFYSVIDTASSLSESHEGNASSDELVGRSPAGSPCGDHNHNTSFVSADSRTDAMAERPLSPVSVVAPWSVTAWEGGRALQHYTPTLGIGSEWNNPFGKYLPQQTSDLTGTRGWKCLHPDDRVAYSAVNNLLTQSVDKDFISSFWRDHNRSSVSQQRLLTGQSSSTRGRWPHSSVSAGPLTAGTSRTQNCPRKGKYFGRPCDACNHRLRQQWTKCQQIQDYDGGSSEKQGLYLLDLSSKTPSMENVQVQHPMHKVSSPNRGLPKLASLKKELTDPQFYDRHKDDFVTMSPSERKWLEEMETLAMADRERSGSPEDTSEYPETERKGRVKTGKDMKARAHKHRKISDPQHQDADVRQAREKLRKLSRKQSNKIYATARSKESVQHRDAERESESTRKTTSISKRKSSSVSRRVSSWVSGDDAELSGEASRGSATRLAASQSIPKDDAAKDRRAKPSQLLLTVETSDEGLPEGFEKPQQIVQESTESTDDSAVVQQTSMERVHGGPIPPGGKKKKGKGRKLAPDRRNVDVNPDPHRTDLAQDLLTVDFDKELSRIYSDRVVQEAEDIRYLWHTNKMAKSKDLAQESEEVSSGQWEGESRSHASTELFSEGKSLDKKKDTTRTRPRRIITSDKKFSARQTEYLKALEDGEETTYLHIQSVDIKAPLPVDAAELRIKTRVGAKPPSQVLQQYSLPYKITSAKFLQSEGQPVHRDDENQYSTEGEMQMFLQDKMASEIDIASGKEIQTVSASKERVLADKGSGAISQDSLTPHKLVSETQQPVTQRDKYDSFTERIKSFERPQLADSQADFLVEGELIRYFNKVADIDAPIIAPMTTSHDQRLVSPPPVHKAHSLQLNPSFVFRDDVLVKDSKKEKAARSAREGAKVVHEIIASRREQKKPVDMTSRAIHGKACGTFHCLHPVTPGLSPKVISSGDIAEDSCHMANHEQLRELATGGVWEDGLPRTIAPHEARWRRVPPRLFQPWLLAPLPAADIRCLRLRPQHHRIADRGPLPFYGHIRKGQAYGRSQSLISEESLQPLVTSLYLKGVTPRSQTPAKEKQATLGTTFPVQLSKEYSTSSQADLSSKDQGVTYGPTSLAQPYSEGQRDPLMEDVTDDFVDTRLAETQTQPPGPEGRKTPVLSKQRQQYRYDTRRTQPSSGAPTPFPSQWWMSLKEQGDSEFPTFDSAKPVLPLISKCPYFKRVRWGTRDRAGWTGFEDVTDLRISSSCGHIRHLEVRPTPLFRWQDRTQEFLGSDVFKSTDISTARYKSAGDPGLERLKKLVTAASAVGRRPMVPGSKAPSFYIGSPYHRDRFFFGYKRSMLTLDMKEAELQTLEQTRQREILLADRLGPKQVMHQRPWSVVRSPHMLEHVRKGRKILEASQDTSKLLKNYNQLMDSILHYEIPGVKSMRDNYAVLFNRQSCESLDDDLLSSSVSSDSNNTSRRFPALYTPQQPDTISTHILADQQQTSL